MGGCMVDIGASSCWRGTPDPDHGSRTISIPTSVLHFLPVRLIVPPVFQYRGIGSKPPVNRRQTQLRNFCLSRGSQFRRRTTKSFFWFGFGRMAAATAPEDELFESSNTNRDPTTASKDARRASLDGGPRSPNKGVQHAPQLIMTSDGPWLFVRLLHLKIVVHAKVSLRGDLNLFFFVKLKMKCGLIKMILCPRDRSP